MGPNPSSRRRSISPSVVTASGPFAASRASTSASTMAPNTDRGGSIRIVEPLGGRPARMASCSLTCNAVSIRIAPTRRTPLPSCCHVLSMCLWCVEARPSPIASSGGCGGSERWSVLEPGDFPRAPVGSALWNGACRSKGSSPFPCRPRAVRTPHGNTLNLFPVTSTNVSHISPPAAEMCFRVSCGGYCLGVDSPSLPRRVSSRRLLGTFSDSEMLRWELVPPHDCTGFWCSILASRLLSVRCTAMLRRTWNVSTPFESTR